MKQHLVVVEWQDAASYDPWQHLFDAEDHCPSKCKTVGWLLSKTKTHVTVAASQSDTGNWSQLMAVPRGCITSLRRLD